MGALPVHSRELKLTKHKTSGSFKSTSVAKYICLMKHRQGNKLIPASTQVLKLTKRVRFEYTAP
jgi:hypothetical protein